MLDVLLEAGALRGQDLDAVLHEDVEVLQPALQGHLQQLPHERLRLSGKTAVAAAIGHTLLHTPPRPLLDSTNCLTLFSLPFCLKNSRVEKVDLFEYPPLELTRRPPPRMIDVEAVI